MSPNARELEELTLNAWPALQTLLCDGWLLRFSNGYTRRSNSVNPLYAGELDLARKIAYAEEQYSARGQPTIVKITPAALPRHLDAELARRGYAGQALTSVQTLSLAALAGTDTPGFYIEADPSDNWLARFSRFTGIADRHRPTMARMLSAIVPRRGFATLWHADEPVAIGLAVAERGWLSLFDIATAPAHRGRGHGRRLTQALLSWGREQGAQHAQLGVMCDNVAALSLYAGLGFVEAYRYWYRVSA